MRDLVNEELVKVKGTEFKGENAEQRRAVYDNASSVLQEFDDFGLALGVVINRKFVAYAETTDNELALRTYARMILSNAHTEFNKDITSMASKVAALYTKVNSPQRVKMTRELCDLRWKFIVNNMIGKAKP
jgi:hypothetical protein